MSLISKNYLFLDSTYLLYENTGINSLFFVPALIRSIISFITILLNLSVIYITIKYRKKYSSIKSNISILLTINSFFEILHQSGQFIFLVISASGKNLIPFGKIVLFQTHSIIGFSSAIFMFTTLSFDRLLTVLFPIFYKTLNQRQHIYLHFILIILFNFYIIFIIIKTLNDYYNWPINGTINDFLELIRIENKLLASIPLLFTPPIILYFLIGLKLYFRKVNCLETMKKIYRSLFLIVFINIDGYLLTFLITLYILMPFNYNQLTIKYLILQNISAIILNLHLNKIISRQL
ncbi:hypothetical protein Mgra_00004239 [Meloidogyne graminicola]|uniref:G-protein coupled receptors family 1 profile domain-containing protein n=1 Tax=Meloidogyne graminicola TaxID=189291 RepID=A0A8S9ZRL3_9BILA|nr:hypothetical protein Mgra_00004239 [Meloidogyne graminicola]